MVGFYLPIAKIDREQRMVWGYASTPARDLDGEVIALAAIRSALPDYMQWRNVREMHQPSAVGVAEEANIDDKGLYLGARIVDDEAWKKVLAEVYKGFSIGGNVTERQGSTVTGLELIEISLVDRPANPDCRIEVIKAAGEAGGAKAEAPDEETDQADPAYLPDGRGRHPIDAAGPMAASMISPGVTRMAEGDVGKRAPNGAHAGHLKKAIRHLGEAHRNLGVGMVRLARAEGALSQGGEGDGLNAPELNAPELLARAAQHFGRAQEQHVLAHHHMAAALGAAWAGHVGEPGEAPGDEEAGLYEPESGLMPLGFDHMTGGNVPDYEADRPYPGKAARGVLTKREADALAEAAYLRGKVEALEKMPASPRAKLFAVPRGAFGVSEADETSTMEKLLKGVNLDAVEPAQRQAAGARLIGNMIANAGIFARPVIGDPSFRGGAGAGRSSR